MHFLIPLLSPDTPISSVKGDKTPSENPAMMTKTWNQILPKPHSLCLPSTEVQPSLPILLRLPPIPIPEQPQSLDGV